MRKLFLPPQPKTGPNTVLHLKLYEPLVKASTAFDYSLNNHPGTLKATAALTFPGCDLDGDSDYIEVASHADFSPVLTPLSISAWVNMDDATNFVVAIKVATDKKEWWAYMPSDKVTFLVYDESEGSHIGRRYNTVLTSFEGEWIHLVCTYDGGITNANLKIYLNGARVDDANMGSGTFVELRPDTAAVRIGAGGGLYANGKIDDVIIYNKLLTAADALDIYNITKWRYGR